MRFFPDSNFFFQFKDAREVDWSMVTEAADIELYVARTVHQEIDRHKGGGNIRRADRARKASSLLRKVLESPDKAIVYREAKPRVTLRLAPRLDPNREKSEALDLTQPDDRLIEEVLSHRNANPGVHVVFLTDDGPAMATALDIGLEYVAIPDEWRLPPEPSAEAKEIADLRRRVTTLEKTSPILELRARDGNGTQIGNLEVDYVWYESITSSELQEVMTELNRLYPMRRDFDEPLESQRKRSDSSAYPGIFEKNVWRPPSEHTISRYHTSYGQWVRDIEQSIKSYHAYLNVKQRTADVHFELENTGSLPANDLSISFSSAGGLLLDIKRKYKGKPNGGLKLPPDSPAGSYVSVRGLRADAYGLTRAVALPEALFGNGVSALPLRDNLMLREPDDPYSFYYHPKHRIASDDWELRCQQFRHQLDAKAFGWVVSLDENITESKGVIRVRVAASNVPTPVSLNLPVRIRKKSLSIRDEVLAAIDPLVLTIRDADRREDER